MMVFGQRLFGRCEDVPGLFYVSTQFFHINYVPLFPMESWLVFDGSENNEGTGTSWRGHKIPMNGKSVLYGWGRAALIIGAIVLAVIGMTESGKYSSNSPWPYWVASAGAIGAYFASRRFAKASAESAKAVVRGSGLPQESIDELVAIIDHRLETVADLPDGVA